MFYHETYYISFVKIAEIWYNISHMTGHFFTTNKTYALGATRLFKEMNLINTKPTP